MLQLLVGSRTMKTLPLLLLAFFAGPILLADASPMAAARDDGVQTLQQQLLLLRENEEVLRVPVEARSDELFDLMDMSEQKEESDDWMWNKRDGKQQMELIRPPIVEPGSVSRIMTGAAQIVSTSKERLVLSPSSQLYATPGSAVSLDFLLQNLDSSSKYFLISVAETQGVNGDDGSGGGGSGVNFPAGSFFNSLSQDRMYVQSNDTRPIVINLRIPQRTPVGQVNAFTLSVQPERTAGGNIVVRRFYFAVSGDVDPGTLDRTAPACTVLQDTSREQCGGGGGDTPFLCRSKTWVAEFRIQDQGSGLRSLIESPAVSAFNEFGAYYAHDNFIIGTRLAAGFYYTSNCCQGEVNLAVTDVARNSGFCRAGPNVIPGSGGGGNSEPEVQLGGLTIGIIVVVVALVLIVVCAVIAIVVIKRKRKADLAEMRATPQER